MIITLELSPEVEARLRADASAQRVPVETLAAQAVEAFLSPSTLPKGQRRAAIEAGFGSLRGVLSSDRFLAARHAEAADELAKSQDTVWSNP